MEVDGSANAKLFWMLKDSLITSLASKKKRSGRFISIIERILDLYLHSFGKNRWISCLEHTSEEFNQILNEDDEFKAYHRKRSSQFQNFSSILKEKKVLELQIQEVEKKKEELDEFLIKLVSKHKNEFKNRTTINSKIASVDKLLNIEELLGCILKFLPIIDIVSGPLLSCWGFFHFVLSSSYAVFHFDDSISNNDLQSLFLERPRELKNKSVKHIGIDVLRFDHVRIKTKINSKIMNMIEINQKNMKRVDLEITGFNSTKRDDLESGSSDSCLDSSTLLVFLDIISDMKRLQNLRIVIYDCLLSSWHFQTTSFDKFIKSHPNLRSLELRTSFLSEDVLRIFLSIPNLEELSLLVEIDDFSRLNLRFLMEVYRRRIENCQRSLRRKSWVRAGEKDDDELKIKIKLLSYPNVLVGKVQVKRKPEIGFVINIGNTTSGGFYTDVTALKNLEGDYGIMNVLDHVVGCGVVDHKSLRIRGIADGADLFSVLLAIRHFDNVQLRKMNSLEIIVDGHKRSILGVPSQLLLDEIFDKKELQSLRIKVAEEEEEACPALIGRRGLPSRPSQIYFKSKWKESLRNTQIRYIDITLFDLEDRKWLELALVGGSNFEEEEAKEEVFGEDKFLWVMNENVNNKKKKNKNSSSEKIGRTLVIPDYIQKQIRQGRRFLRLPSSSKSINNKKKKKNKKNKNSKANMLLKRSTKVGGGSSKSKMNYSSRISRKAKKGKRKK